MTKSTLRVAAALGTSLLVAAGLAACTSSPSDSSAAGTVTITVGDRPSTSDANNRAFFDKQVAAFQQGNPDIKLSPVETTWEATTFQAQVAGGQLPDVLNVPFTEPPGLIARKQVADLTPALKETKLLDELNPTVLKIVQDSSGNVYAVPNVAYSIGLVYNRDLFKKAGLDPDKPPTTWDEVRAYAKKITEATGAAGYAQLTTGNTGGWMFTAQTYAFGGTVQDATGSKATFADAPSAAALKALQDMKWVDRSMGSTVLYDTKGISQDFAAGKIGMYLGSPDAYRTLVVTNGLAPAAFGIGGMPQQNGQHGTLSGGSVQIVSPSTTEAERVAAVKWIRFFYLNKYVDQDAALAAAQAKADAKQPVGVPELPVVRADQYSTYQSWITPQANVPVENFAPYAKVIADQKIIAEPANRAQEVYATLDPVVQTVLTDQRADIPALLSKAASTVDAKLAR